jgi:hypothetical protein
MTEVIQMSIFEGWTTDHYANPNEGTISPSLFYRFLRLTESIAYRFKIWGGILGPRSSRGKYPYPWKLYDPWEEWICPRILDADDNILLFVKRKDINLLKDFIHSINVANQSWELWYHDWNYGKNPVLWCLRTTLIKLDDMGMIRLKIGQRYTFSSLLAFND